MVAELQARKFRCTRCQAVLTVAPAETLSRRLYSAAAIAWALALYGLSLLAPEAVRKLVSPWQVVAASSATRWRTLSRWCAAATAGLFTKLLPLTGTTARQVAAAAATAISAFAVPVPEPPPLDVLAFHGAARAA